MSSLTSALAVIGGFLPVDVVVDGAGVEEHEAGGLPRPVGTVHDRGDEREPEAVAAQDVHPVVVEVQGDREPPPLAA
jgi:hypothetical protein